MNNKQKINAAAEVILRYSLDVPDREYTDIYEIWDVLDRLYAVLTSRGDLHLHEQTEALDELYGNRKTPSWQHATQLYAWEKRIERQNNQ
jgi:hypothetical protein